MQRLQIHSCLSPRIEPAEIDDSAHSALVDSIRDSSPATLDVFAQQVINFENTHYLPKPRSVFIVPDGDKNLENCVRKAMRKLGILAYPFESGEQDQRSLIALNEMKLPRTLKSSNAILLLYGEKGKSDPDWLYDQHRFIAFRLGERCEPPPVAIIDGPPDPRYPEKIDAEPPEPAIFWNDSSEFEFLISKWFSTNSDIGEIGPVI